MLLKKTRRSKCCSYALWQMTSECCVSCPQSVVASNSLLPPVILAKLRCYVALHVIGKYRRRGKQQLSAAQIIVIKNWESL